MKQLISSLWLLIFHYLFFRFFGGGGDHGGFHFNFFGGGHGSRPRTPDVKVQFKVSLQDVYRGAELKVKVRIILAVRFILLFRLISIDKGFAVLVKVTVQRILTM